MVEILKNKKLEKCTLCGCELKPRKQIEEKNCLICGILFNPLIVTQKCCSPACKKERKYQMRIERDNEKWLNTPIPKKGTFSKDRMGIKLKRKPAKWGSYE